jgi:hypothetical protein
MFFLLFVADAYTAPHPRDSIFQVVGPFGLYANILVLVVAPVLFFLRKTRLVKFKPPVQWRSATAPQGCWLLYAVRAPGDEASIVINTSQFIDWISNLLFVRLIFRPYDRLISRLNKPRIKRTRRVLLGSFALLVVLPGLFGWFTGHYIENIVLIIIILVVWLYGLGVLVFSLAALIGPIMLIPANWVLALAVGRDVLRYCGVMQIECEPVPSGITGTVSTVALSDDEQAGLGLVHFIHASNSARGRVREILVGKEF